MDYVSQGLLYFLGGVAAFWLFISFMGSMPVLSMHKAHLTPLDDDEARQILSLVIDEGLLDMAWAKAHNFRPTGAYHVEHIPGNIKMVALTRGDEATYFAAYVVATTHTALDLVSVHGDAGNTLTTGTTKDGRLLPTPPGNWLQSFTAQSIDQLWDRHQEGLQYLISTGGLPAKPAAANLTKHFSSALQGQAKHIRSFTLWPLRVPYWYFIRRNTRHDKPIQQLLKG